MGFDYHLLPYTHCKGGLDSVTHFQKSEYEKGERVTTMEGPNKHYLGQAGSVTPPGHQVDLPHPGLEVLSRVFHLCHMLPKNEQPLSNGKNNSRQTQTEGHSTEDLANAP